MSISERIAYLAIGCFIGFVLGYIARSLSCIKDELHIANNGNRKNTDDKGEIFVRGFKLNTVKKNVALFIVVALTVWASISSQIATNKVTDNQADQKLVSICNKKFLEKTIVALNERTTFTAEAANANLNLQTAQLKFLGALLVKPPPTSQEAEMSFNEYVDALKTFVDVSKKSADKVATNPYPTKEELQACLNGRS